MECHSLHGTSLSSRSTQNSLDWLPDLASCTLMPKVTSMSCVHFRIDRPMPLLPEATLYFPVLSQPLYKINIYLKSIKIWGYLYSHWKWEKKSETHEGGKMEWERGERDRWGSRRGKYFSSHKVGEMLTTSSWCLWWLISNDVRFFVLAVFVNFKYNISINQHHFTKSCKEVVLVVINES